MISMVVKKNLKLLFCTVPRKLTAVSLTKGIVCGAAFMTRVNVSGRCQACRAQSTRHDMTWRDPPQSRSTRRLTRRPVVLCTGYKHDPAIKCSQLNQNTFIDTSLAKKLSDVSPPPPTLVPLYRKNGRGAYNLFSYHSDLRNSTLSKLSLTL